MAKTEISTEIPAAPRLAPVIDPARVELQHSGQVWREYLVRVPSDFVADDLKEPGVWRKLQNGSRNALRKFDRVTVVAYDETWLAEAIVASADAKGAVLAKPRITTMPARFDKLFEDDKYRVAWNGFGYVVERKSDGHVMTQATANAELATRLLTQLYPARVA
ncbi:MULTISPECIES: hypothetical protein [unclassified Mesorhizobium]|uniref:hypothetical protein n=1 Tax=unclassified Mesorhizobium TaxID=325217 RepID=UPI000FD738E8|nr:MULTISPECIES: hypothetical protein [unclassified Mesorhizobium]TGR39576.1 hypothetical protein EN842_40810 [bacterium M00.F.Ca.ET.199.01.1.1]TGU29013.1 hypothetical protein EN799_35985 [bacterium M00.F.Ca.ET.156.01.1.1]TGV84284.1 hypothetical protein EN792_021505 [Mesorhizobium sp. M00.F.Ca.ET.149.01.1.1]TGR22403.1 hypothetical protein EN845_22125 [Mesorhizobium sp. M8A.F.Ca.ET.202.01.1.1]TGR23884.1 hypothetical protein EN840_20770 [Mesorhizobium sp. M8A.F.Ca.ET.197.01.1.1]